MKIVGSKLASQLHAEAQSCLLAVLAPKAKALRGNLKPSSFWNEWQEGRADEYQLIDQATCELMGYSGLTFAIELLKALCERVADLSGVTVRATDKLQLACFPAGAEGYDAHTDGSSYEDLDDSMPSDQRAMISSRIGRGLGEASERHSAAFPQENHRDTLLECAVGRLGLPWTALGRVG